MKLTINIRKEDYNAIKDRAMTANEMRETLHGRIYTAIARSNRARGTLADDRIFLLSEEEVKELPVKYLTDDSMWWLRTPSYKRGFAAVVDTSWGSVSVVGKEYVKYRPRDVRPAIYLENLAEMPKNKNGNIEYLGIEWYDISKYLDKPVMLAAKSIGQVSFGDSALDYEGSEVRAFILDWLEEREREYRRRA